MTEPTENNTPDVDWSAPQLKRASAVECARHVLTKPDAEQLIDLAEYILFGTRPDRGAAERLPQDPPGFLADLAGATGIEHLTLETREQLDELPVGAMIHGDKDADELDVKVKGHDGHWYTVVIDWCEIIVNGLPWEADELLVKEDFPQGWFYCGSSAERELGLDIEDLPDTRDSDN